VYIFVYGTAAGGQSEEGGTASNLVERYDFETKAWEEMAPMATARFELDGRLYAAGAQGWWTNVNTVFTR